jgi:hypothetical protein
MTVQMKWIARVCDGDSLMVWFSDRVNTEREAEHEARSMVVGLVRQGWDQQSLTWQTKVVPA